MDQKIIWLIDENEHQIQASYHALTKILPDSVKVEMVFPPYRSIADYQELLIIRDG